MQKVQIKRMVYGYRDHDVLGPVNFVHTHDLVQVILMDDECGFDRIYWVREFLWRGQEKTMRLIRTFCKEMGWPTKGHKIETVYSGARYY